MKKKVIEETMKFCDSIVQEVQLEKLTKQLQEADKKLATLKTALTIMPPIISITQSTKLIELQQWVGKA